MNKNNQVAVYICPLTEAQNLSDIYPKERKEEILACSSKKVINEKYTAWKLLEKALKEQWGKSMQDLSFVKKENGKWNINDGYFSIAHSKGVVVVALSKAPVGTDVEKALNFNKRLLNRVATTKEKEQLTCLQKEEMGIFLSKLWTKKESIFKLLGKGNFSPNDIECEKYYTVTQSINSNGNVFFLSVATENISEINIFNNLPE